MLLLYSSEHILRFTRVASRILSSLVKKEAVHGRVIVMGLISVPGLWRGMISLTVIVSQYKALNCTNSDPSSIPVY